MKDEYNEYYEYINDSINENHDCLIEYAAPEVRCGIYAMINFALDFSLITEEQANELRSEIEDIRQSSIGKFHY